MERKEALNKYVKKYILKLTTPTTTKEVEKALRKDFSETNSLDSRSRFSAVEVAVEVATYLIKSTNLGREEFIKRTTEIQFLAETLSVDKLEVLYDKHSSSSSLFLKVEDLSKLNQEEFLKKIEDEFKAKASVRAEIEVKQQKMEVEELRVELERKTEELRKFESELNKLPSDMKTSEIEKQVENTPLVDLTDTGQVWWKRLGLPSNPLETYDGLYGISRDRFDDIVVKTPLVRTYLSDIQADPEVYKGKTIMLIGDFGSGKTTIFQYLSAQAISRGVAPINILLNPAPSVASLTNLFLQELINELSEIYKSIKNFDPRSQGGTGNLYRDNLDLFNNLSSEVQHGFLIFVDGLHKTEVYVDQVMEFLQQIQTISEFFIKNGVKIGFFIAGSPLWNIVLESKPSLSGSYYRTDIIPLLTEEYAIEAIKRRINFYQTETLQPITIEDSGLRKSFQVLSERLQKGITFRDFITHVRRRLELNNFEEVGLTVRIHIETVDAVKANLRRSRFYENYRSLISEISNSYKLRVALQKVATLLLLNKGVSENTDLFKGNQGAFYLLRKYDFIVQRKTSDGDMFKWHLSDELLAATLQISQSLNLEPKRVLHAMFQEETLTKASETDLIYGTSIHTIDKLISTWKDSIPEVIILLEQCKQHIELVRNNLAEMMDVSALDLGPSIIYLIKAINMIMYPQNTSDVSDSDVFLNSWAAPDNIDEIREYCDRRVKVKNTYGALHNHNKIVSQLLEILSDQVRGEAVTRLSDRNILPSQSRTIHQLRIKFLNQSYEEVIDGVCSMLEYGIREIIYPCMRVLWGQSAISKLPKDIQGKIEKLPERGHPRTKRKADINFLYDVSRSEYSKIIFSREVYEGVLESVFSDADKKKFQNSVDLSFSLDNRVAHRDRKSYFRLHATEVSSILSALPWEMEKLREVEMNFLQKCNISFLPEDDKLKVKFLPSERRSLASITVEVSKPILDRFAQTILEFVSYKNIVIEYPGTLFSLVEFEPEISFSAFRATLTNGFVEINKNPFLGDVLSITQKGRNLLTKYATKSQPPD